MCVATPVLLRGGLMVQHEPSSKINGHHKKGRIVEKKIPLHYEFTVANHNVHEMAYRRTGPAHTDKRTKRQIS